VLEKVKECIVNAVGVDYEEIELHSQLTNDLGADSLDLVDFDISLQRGVIIKRIENIISIEEFMDEETGIVTPRGIEIIRREIPELSAVEFEESLKLPRLVSYFTVEIFVNLVTRALLEREMVESL
jgi:acyl carrier protein